MHTTLDKPSIEEYREMGLSKRVHGPKKSFGSVDFMVVYTGTCLTAQRNEPGKGKREATGKGRDGVTVN